MNWCSPCYFIIAYQKSLANIWKLAILLFLAGHLDRVVTGVVAEEILSACDELGSGGGGVTGADGQSGLANPAIHMLRGLRHRNLAAIRHAAQVSFSFFFFFFLSSERDLHWIMLSHLWP